MRFEWIYSQSMSTYCFYGDNKYICRVSLKPDTMFSVAHVRMGTTVLPIRTDAEYLMFELKCIFHLKQKMRFYRV